MCIKQTRNPCFSKEIERSHPLNQAVQPTSPQHGGKRKRQSNIKGICLPSPHMYFNGIILVCLREREREREGGKKGVKGKLAVQGGGGSE